MNLPANQTVLVAPTTAPRYITLGVGYQNYTCSSTTLTYSSIGALASLFDLSCMASKPEFADVQSKAYDIWIAPGDVKATANSIGAKVDAPTLLGPEFADVQSKAYDIWIAPGDVKATANSIGAKVDAPTLLGVRLP
uniref:Uncharacterized protein n=1 Tax=Mycena chlorophos TaxID=658473 RepID=A0ABQ0LND7_MYCCL|nr:predicted protein [Mycena chlorophos]